MFALGLLTHLLLAGREAASLADVAALDSPPLARLSAQCTHGAALASVLRVLAQRDDVLVPSAWRARRGALPVRAAVLCHTVLPVRAHRERLGVSEEGEEKLRAVLAKIAELIAAPLASLQVKAAAALAGLAGETQRTQLIARESRILTGLSSLIALAGQVGKFDVVEQALLAGLKLASSSDVAKAWALTGVVRVLLRAVCEVEDMPTVKLAGAVIAELSRTPEVEKELRAQMSMTSMVRMLGSGRPSAVMASLDVLSNVMRDRRTQDAFLGEGGWQWLMQAYNVSI